MKRHALEDLALELAAGNGDQVAALALLLLLRLRWGRIHDPVELSNLLARYRVARRKLQIAEARSLGGASAIC
jgi:hypothetical protein